MDMPIYLQFLDLEYDASRPPTPGPQYRWFVIEERGDQETTADELGEHKSPDDRVRDLNLPHLNYDVDHAAFAVSGSRLFFVGGINVREDKHIIEPNGILYIDLQKQQPSDFSWKRCEKWGENIRFVNGAGVSEDGDSIYALLPDTVLRFDCRNVEAGNFLPPSHDDSHDDSLPRILLAWTGSDMLLYDPLDVVVIFNMKSFRRTDTYILRDSPAQWSYMPSPFYSTVAVGDFVIYFADSCPMKKHYCPALYVYDMFSSKWLSQPVQGLLNDGIILPSLKTQRTVCYSSLMRVRRDVLKLALVWSIDMEDDEDGGVNDHTEIHWSKFILHIQGEEKDRTFCAEILSSGTCYGGHTLLINCTAG